MNKNQTTVLCFSGNDPCGGAGIQADIETLAKHQVHCLPLITLNTIQDSKGIQGIHKTPDDFLQQQFELIQKDIHIDAIKLGLLADTEQILCIKNLIKKIPNVPVILDPILASGLGSAIKQEDFIKTLCKELLPLSFICIPNFPEAQKLCFALTGKTEQNMKAIAVGIIESGTKHVLITGTHHDEKNTHVTHGLFNISDQELEETEFSNPRLEKSYHGSGCTLSSAIAANLANRKNSHEAVSDALNFTYHSLKTAHSLGKHQLFPNRF